MHHGTIQRSSTTEKQVDALTGYSKLQLYVNTAYTLLTAHVLLEILTNWQAHVYRAYSISSHSTKRQLERWAVCRQSVKAFARSWKRDLPLLLEPRHYLHGRNHQGTFTLPPNRLKVKYLCLSYRSSIWSHAIPPQLLIHWFVAMYGVAPPYLTPRSASCWKVLLIH